MNKAKYYIYEKKIDSNCKRLKDAFEGLNFQPAYSVKTNNVPLIVKRMYENGLLIECVSDMEVEIAEKLCIPLSSVIYNGPMKGGEAMYVAAGGGIVSFDSETDMDRFKYPSGTRCMIRVAADIDNGIDTRFGTQEKDVRKLIEKAIRKGFVVEGIHCHCTNGRTIRKWSNRIDVMSRVYNDVNDLLHAKIVDFGGNMYSPLSEDAIEEFEEYASYEDYAQLFAKRIGDLKDAKIILEMGTSIVANCVKFRTPVLAIKHTEKNTFILLDCCKYNLGWATDHYNFPLEIVKNSDNCKETVEDAYFVGRLCTENDIVYSHFSGRIAVGDVVEFSDAGAYTICIKPPFIIPQKAVMYIDTDGHERVAKEAEGMEDLMTTYRWE